MLARFSANADASAPVSVIIVTFNSRAHFPRLKRALEAQSQPARLLVVDNASAPDQRPLAADFPIGAEIVQLLENTGFARANNLAVSLVDTPLVALLNPDAFPEPNWLAALVRAAERTPEAASFGSTQISAEDPSKFDGLGDCYHVLGIPWRGGYGWPISTPARAGRIFSACAAAALYRRAAWHEIGGFDESYFCYCEDVDLGFRLRLAGWGVLQVAEARVHHVGGASSGVRSDFSVYHGTRNRLWTFVKNMPLPVLWLLVPCHAAATLFLLARAHGQGTWPATLRGLTDGVKGLGVVWRARASVQRQRRASSIDVLRAMTWSLAALRTRAPMVR